MKLLSSLFGFFEHRFRNLKEGVISMTNKQPGIVKKWYREDPYEQKKHQFDHLDKSSLVVDLGGYIGDWASQIYSRYCCRVMVFEPVSAYYKCIKDRFKKNNDISPYPYGLSDKYREESISVNEFASSTFNARGNQTEKIVLQSFSDFISSEGIDQIDLVKINIEGGEYDLLFHLIETGWTTRIKCFLIQFHDFVDNAEEKRNRIKEKLSITHHCVFDYPFVWECWKIK